jgi:hypothetical protein
MRLVARTNERAWAEAVIRYPIPGNGELLDTGVGGHVELAGLRYCR